MIPPCDWGAASVGVPPTSCAGNVSLSRSPGIDATTQHNHLLVFVRYAVSRLTIAVARLSLPPSCDDLPIYLRTFRLHKRKMSADFLAADYDNSSADATLRMLLPLAAAFTTIAADGIPAPTHTSAALHGTKAIVCWTAHQCHRQTGPATPSHWSLFSHLWVQGALV